MQGGVVEDGAQTTLFADPADRRDDIGLVEIVGEDVDLGLGVLFAVRNEVE
jgi:hypothetical protein